MRTTLTLDDKLAKALKTLAHDSGRSFKEVVNQALRSGLTAENAPPKPKPYKVKPARLGGVLPGFNLDKALQIADRLDDEELARKIELRK
jgi:hypothetical protein